MILSDISTRKRHDTLWLALGFVLQDIPGDSSTAVIADWLRLRVGFPRSEMALVMTWLKKVAPQVAEAHHTGETVKVYGRYGRRWVWSPRVGTAPVPVARAPIVMGYIETMLNESGVVDTTEW